MSALMFVWETRTAEFAFFLMKDKAGWEPAVIVAMNWVVQITKIS